MWAALSAGAFVGAIAYRGLGMHAILVATALTLLLSLVAVLMRIRGRRHGSRVRVTVEPY
ncbi:hypothetical protein QP028_11925 [Corynebacterium suedekumii]|nr:hypothetical protein QP028_11925 [Corynebacterium suedekumii]